MKLKIIKDMGVFKILHRFDILKDKPNLSKSEKKELKEIKHFLNN